MAPFYHDTFDRLAPSKREVLLRIATQEFADKGFHGTSINALARRAGMPIGTLYTYFGSKEDLFLTVVDLGHQLLEQALGDLDADQGVLAVFEALLRRAQQYAVSNPEFHRIYLDATTHGLRDLAKRLSSRLETLTVEFYQRVLPPAAARGEIRGDLDLGAVALLLDNLIMMFQFSFASDYHLDRLRLFLGLAESEAVDHNALISSLVAFVRSALMPPTRSLS